MSRGRILQQASFLGQLLVTIPKPETAHIRQSRTAYVHIYLESDFSNVTWELDKFWG